MKKKMIKVSLIVVFLIITGIIYILFNKPEEKDIIKSKSNDIKEIKSTTNTFSDSEEANTVENNILNENSTTTVDEQQKTNNVEKDEKSENNSTNNRKATEPKVENKVDKEITTSKPSSPSENTLSTGSVDKTEITNNNQNPDVSDTNKQDVPKEESNNKLDNTTNSENYPEIYAYSYDECFRLGEQEQIRLALESEKNLNIRFSCRQKEVNSEIRFYLYLEIYE